MKLLKRYGTLGMKIVSTLALLAGIFFSAPSHALQIGDRVQANGTVNVRSSAAGSFLGTQASGNQGGIIAGPQTASLGGMSYTWWSVNWDAGVDGWVADIGLTPIAPAAPVAQSDLIPQNISLSSGTVSPGASLTVNWTLANIGSGAANAGSTTVVRINQSTTSAAPVANLASVSTAALGAGASVGQSATITAPSTPGTYYVWVIADNYGAVSNQSNTSNDLQHSAAFTVAATTPTVSSVYPATMTANNTSQTLSIYGSNFQSGNVVQFQYASSGGWVNALQTPSIGANQITIGMNPGGSNDTIYVRVCGTSGCSTNTPYVTVTAAALQVLSVTPTSMSAGATSGTMSFSVSNTGGGGTLNYSTSVTSGSSWLSIDSGASGGNSGTITVSYTANTGTQRSGTIQVMASGATGSPATLTVTQAGASNVSSFQTGQRITAASGGVNVWDGTLTSILFQQQGGVHGTLVGNPVNETVGGVTDNWWQINWDSAPPNLSGQAMWSTETLLSLAPSTADVPKPDFSSSYYAPVNGNNSLSANIFVRSGEAPTSTPEAIDFSNSALGNCTWYAYGRLLELGANAGQLSALRGNAGDWASEAQQTGISVDTNPTVGSIAQLNSKLGYPAGHVAVVEYVNPDKTLITVTESSYVPNASNPWNFLWRHRTVSPTWFDNFIHASGVGGGTSTDTTPPTISAFSVTPSSIALGSPLTISLTAADAGGSGLNRVEFKRSNGDGTANDPNWTTINTAQLSGNGPQTATFSDQPTTAGTWWYGVWVYDNSGNRIDERATGLGPLSITVGTSSIPADCLFNWAERTYPNLFAPAGAASKTFAPYYYRYYAQTRSYLASSSADNHLYYVGPISNNGIRDVGALPTWLTSANCSVNGSGSLAQPLPGALTIAKEGDFFDVNYNNGVTSADQWRQHLGTDFIAAPYTNVVSVSAGTVIYCNTTLNDPFNSAVIVQQPDGTQVVYGHIYSNLTKNTSTGNCGSVETNQSLGYVQPANNSSPSYVPHVHMGYNTKGLALPILLENGEWGWGRAPFSTTRAQAESRGWVNINTFYHAPMQQ